MIVRIIKIAILIGSAVLSGCASQILEGYVGKSITEPMLDYGRPAEVFDLPNGRRAFQWSIDSSGSIPITTPTTSSIYGSQGWASVTTNTTTYHSYSQNCRYTLIGVRQGKDWIIESFRKPTLVCE